VPGLTLKLGSMFTLDIVNGLRVSQLAERAGVAPSTVRFYERAGLLSPARRAANGYREYDETALEELAFVSRAKGIGMTLEDIAGLIAAWPTGDCQSLQARMRVYLTGRISQVHDQLAELDAFEHQLQAVLSRLSARDPGPEQCGKGCGCEIDLDITPGQTAPSPTPWACSPGPGAPTSRTSQWSEVAAAATSAEHTSGTIRLRLPASPDLATSVAALCAAETTSRPQTRFHLQITAGQMTLTIEAPHAGGLPGIVLPPSTPSHP